MYLVHFIYYIAKLHNQTDAMSQFAVALNENVMGGGVINKWQTILEMGQTSTDWTLRIANEQTI